VTIAASQIAASEMLSVLAAAGAHVRLILRDGRVVFARVVVGAEHGRVSVRPWGRADMLDLHVHDVRSASLSRGLSWAAANRIAAQQARAR
jgi:hypothetical protein